MAVGTRTAPTVDGTPASHIVSMSFVDSRGDSRTESFVIIGALVQSEVEALVSAIAGASEASLYEVKVSAVYSGAKNLSNANSVGSGSADDKVFLTLRDSINRVTKRLYIPSPDVTILPAGGETVNTGATEFVAITNALTPLLGTYTFSTVSFVERQESNRAQQL